MCTIQIDVDERSLKGKACIAFLKSLDIAFVRMPKKMSSLQKALDDVRNKRTTRYKSVDDMMSDLMKD